MICVEVSAQKKQYTYISEKRNGTTRCYYGSQRLGLNGGQTDVSYRKDGSYSPAVENLTNVLQKDECVLERTSSVVTKFSGISLRGSKEGYQQLAPSLVNLLTGSSFEINGYKL